MGLGKSLLLVEWGQVILRNLQSGQVVLLSKEKEKEVPALAVTLPTPDSGVVSNVPQSSHPASEVATDRGPLLANEYQNATSPASAPSVLTVPSAPVTQTPGVPREFSLPNMSPSSTLLAPQHPSASTGPSNLATTPLASASPSKNITYCITLARGFQLHYSKSDLQQPRSFQGLVSHPVVLYSLWEDSSPTWNPNNCPLIIRGVSIAIKYWGNFYRNFKRKNVWEEIKQNWSDFKVTNSTVISSIPH